MIMKTRQMIKSKQILLIALVSIVIVLISGIFPLQIVYGSQTPCNWTGSGDGITWEDASNWDCGVSPNGAQYDVVICRTDVTATENVTTNSHITLGKFTLGEHKGGAQSCSGQSHVLTIGDDFTVVDTDGPWAGDLLIGTYGTFDPRDYTVSVARDFDMAWYDAPIGTVPRFLLNNEVYHATVKMTGTGIFSISADGHYDEIHAAYPGHTTTFLQSGGSVLRVQEGPLVLNGGVLTGPNSAIRFAEPGVSKMPFQPNGSDFTGIKGMNYGMANEDADDFTVGGGTYKTLTITSIHPNLIATMEDDITIIDDFTIRSSGKTIPISRIYTNGYDLTANGKTTFGRINSSSGREGGIVATGDSVVTLDDLETLSTGSTEAIRLEGTSSLVVNGDFDLSTHPIEANGNTTTFQGAIDGSKEINVPSGTFGSVVFTGGTGGSDDYILGSDLSINNDLIIDDASLNLEVGGHDVTLAGNLDFIGTGYIAFGETDSIIFSGNTVINTASSTLSQIIIENAIVLPGATLQYSNEGGGPPLFFMNLDVQ
tara:strand:+ start:8880 stop:10499 length:1620 start_codon:yes stop_codon:yes gene_type:complete